MKYFDMWTLKRQLLRIIWTRPTSVIAPTKQSIPMKMYQPIIWKPASVSSYLWNHHYDVGVEIYQNDISSCFTPNSIVMINYKTFHLKHYIVFVKICPPNGQITFWPTPLKIEFPKLFYHRHVGCLSRGIEGACSKITFFPTLL